MRIHKENDVSGCSHVQRWEIFVRNFNIAMHNSLSLSNKSCGTISGLFNYPTIFLNGASKSVLAFNTESLGVSCINVLDDRKGKVRWCTNLGSSWICSSTTTWWFNHTSSESSTISCIDICEQRGTGCVLTQSHILWRCCIWFGSIIGTTSSWILIV